MNEVNEKKYNGFLDMYTEEIIKEEEKKNKGANEQEYQKLLSEVSSSINIEEIKNKSVVNNSIVKYDRNKKTTILKQKLNMKTVAIVLACITALSVAPSVYNEISYNHDSREVIEQVSMDASLKLSSSGLFVVPDPASKEWKNDYSKIENLSEDDLYGMFKYLGTSESEKVVQALGYTGWDNYLSMNGYFNVDGEPSIIVYDNMMESKLVREYRDGKENGKGY